MKTTNRTITVFAPATLLIAALLFLKVDLIMNGKVTAVGTVEFKVEFRTNSSAPQQQDNSRLEKALRFFQFIENLLNPQLPMPNIKPSFRNLT